MLMGEVSEVWLSVMPGLVLTFSGRVGPTSQLVELGETGS